MDSYLQKVLPREEQDYDRAKELKAFDDTKAGVKGLVDAGVVTVPRIFLMPPEDILSTKLNDHVNNHGIPQDVMNKVIAGVRRFHEEPKEVKLKFYSRENEKKVRFVSIYDLYSSKAANWRDSLFCVMAPNPPPPQEYPSACRDLLIEYSKHVQGLAQILFGLLSEALGLNPSHLIDMGCMEGHAFGCQNYPPCPEPHRTLGQAKHWDPDFLTILLQDQIGALQVPHEGHGIDIPPPADGGLIVNIGDLLQLITNDKFKSVEHRVLANRIGPRVSVACIFSTSHFQESNRLYGPMKELLSAKNPPNTRKP
ncbi:hypothetical protein PTKIN_Ptkin01aG0354600 [Pterospermum kingtungense]